MAKSFPFQTIDSFTISRLGDFHSEQYFKQCAIQSMNHTQTSSSSVRYKTNCIREITCCHGNMLYNNSPLGLLTLVKVVSRHYETAVQ